MTTTLTRPSSETLLDLFRNTFRRHAGGVVVCTTVDDDGTPVGFTATSLASLSAVPPRATFNMIKSSSSFRAVQLGCRIAVNFLGAGSHELGQRFAGPAEERFAGDHWHEERGLPVIDDAGVVLFTKVASIYDHGENAIVVLEIQDGTLGDDQDPLLYHNRRFGTIAPVDPAR
ncbi:flavin reductase family protein [Leucobacter tenebrionis]|uniref:flavin reductase family protein n=1 Tax=Leucobacter tenebrionis TaxID=2873270 RepID=UPI001CA72D16|nr:flavin reductase family protein [Leucobacter tenebrionis]QZY51016.1 flavin reductase family protein [Leucobacter tenebrionis]